MSTPRAASIIVAGGIGSRFGDPGGKQLAPVLGRPVLAWTLAAFDATPAVDLIVIVCDAQETPRFREAAVGPAVSRASIVFAAAGDSRQASVASGLEAVPEGVDTIVVHDGARPVVTPRLIVDALSAFETSGADGLFVGHPAIDTLKVVKDGAVAETPDRSCYWTVQTPQVFSAEALRSAYAAAAACGWEGTDDASLVERNGGSVVAFQGPRDNIKVTVAEDLRFVEAALKYRESGEV